MEPCAFDNLLNGERNIPHLRVLANNLQGSIKRMLRDGEQTLCLPTHLPHGHGEAGICVETFKENAAVDGNDVPFCECSFRRNAMHALLVDGCAEGGGKPLVSLERRNGTLM